jgi:putative N6-adenine-specific DNA methylase
MEIRNPKSEIPIMKIIAKTLYGLEQVLADELGSLGCKDIIVANRAVIFSGDLKTLYMVNYMARTALSFLVTIKEFRINSADDLYQKCLRIDWEEYMDAGKTFSVTAVVNSRFFNHSGFAALKLKDAVADFFRNKTGKRPNVDASDPEIIINLHLSNELVTISLDSSGIPLFKRGYRQEQGIAPLNEVLAAGMLALSGWDAKSDLTDPMCGSGTIPVEAALIATNTPPGKFRKAFGFQRWKKYDATTFTDVAERANAGIRESAIKIHASDISEVAVNQSSKNIHNAGVTSSVSLNVADFSTLNAGTDKGFLIINPPYGERMNTDEEYSVYSMIGSTLKHNYPGHVAWIISSNAEALKHVGLKPSKKLALYNGSLECFFLRYDLYQGSHKAGRS